jgi:hypothetical protein
VHPLLSCGEALVTALLGNQSKTFGRLLGAAAALAALGGGAGGLQDSDGSCVSCAAAAACRQQEGQCTALDKQGEVKEGN